MERPSQNGSRPAPAFKKLPRPRPNRNTLKLRRLSQGPRKPIPASQTDKIDIGRDLDGTAAARPRPEPTNQAPSAQETATLLNLWSRARYAEAEAEARDLTARYPNHGFAWKILGATLDRRGQPDAAIAAKRRAAELLPDDAEAHANLGNSLSRAARHAEAEAAYRRAIQLQPGLASAHNRLGICLQAQGRAEEAEAAYRRAAELQPDLAEAHTNLGIMLWNRSALDEAEAAYRRAIQLDPARAEFHSNLASLLVRSDRLAEAEQCCRRAVALKPDFAEGWNNLGDALEASGRTAEAIAAYRRVLELKPDLAWAFSNLLFCLSHRPEVAPDELFAEHRNFGLRFEPPLRPHWPAHRNTPDPDRLLRVGVLSADLRDHAISYFVAPLFAALASDPALSLHAYYNNQMQDPVTARLRGHFARWTQVGEMTDAELAARIEADSIDILVDLSGHTNGGRLLVLARKPAPIQCGWLGYLGTSGMESIDYYLADPLYLPREPFQRHFTERLVHLPAAAPFQTVADPPDVNPLPALATGRLTFATFSRVMKITPEAVALWSRLLRAVPESRLLLGALPKDAVTGQLTAAFAREGIAPERLLFRKARFIHDYLAEHREVDLCLDSFPFTGATTTGHALWMGVPTLTLAGQTAPGRLGAAMLRHARLDDFVADSPEDYLAKGLRWATDLPALAQLRAGMRDRLRSSVLGRPETVAHALSRAFRSMWQRWCEGLPPQPLP